MDDLSQRSTCPELMDTESVSFAESMTACVLESDSIAYLALPPNTAMGLSA